MLDNYKDKQPLFYNYTKRVIEENKITHAYLIETNEVSYGFDLAIALSKSFLCENHYFNSKKCKDCSICNNIDNNNYPDLKIIEADGKLIKKEQLLDLQKNFSTKPIYGKYLIYIIKNAELLNNSSANTILKFLEEPSENIIAILLTNNVYNCIETIVSRCQILTLNNNEQGIKKLIFNKYCSNQDEIDNFMITETNNIIDYYYELEQKDTKTLLLENIYDYKEKIDLLLQVGLYIYVDLLNIKLDRKVENFSDNLNKLKEIAQKNETNDIIKKIDIINQFLGKVKFNINKELFIDNFIITFSGGIDEN